jgi:hypothetical protein
MNTKVAKHLSIPENRINYSFHFLDNFGYEFVDYKKCYDAIAKWSDKLDTSESQLQERINKLIEVQGEDAHCAAWIYTKHDCHLKDEDGEFDYQQNVEDPEVVERIFDDVGNIDYIYQVIQECVDEVTEEQVMLQQQELAEVE